MSNNLWIALLALVFVAVLVFVPFQLGNEPTVFQHWQQVGAEQALAEIGIAALVIFGGLCAIAAFVLTGMAAGRKEK